MSDYVVVYAGNYNGAVEASSIEEAAAIVSQQPFARPGQYVMSMSNWKAICAAVQNLSAKDARAVRLAETESVGFPVP